MTAGIFKKRCHLLVIAALLLIFCGYGLPKGLTQGTEEKEGPKRISVIKEVTGEVTWLKKGRYIAVAFPGGGIRSEAEMLLPIDSDIKVERKKSLDEISAGDTVRVKYEEVTELWPDGSVNLIGRKAKVIDFIRSAPKKPEEGKTLKSG